MCRPVDGGLEVTYIVRTALNGSLPRAIVDKVASEIPLCTGRARDVYHNSRITNSWLPLRLPCDAHTCTHVYSSRVPALHPPDRHATRP